MTGHALKSIGQPIGPVPGAPALFSFGLQAAPAVLKGRVRETVWQLFLRQAALFEKLARCSIWFFGSDLIFPIAVRYVTDMLQSDAHFSAYCGYAAALGRHDVIGRLNEIKIPALVVAGTPDFVTPARCSYDMAASLGGPTRLLDDF